MFIALSIRSVRVLINIFEGHKIMEPIAVLSKTFIELSQISPWYWILASIIGVWCFLSGRLRFALNMLYFLALYQVYISNKFYWIDFFGGQPMGLYTYIFSSTIMVLLGLVSLCRESY